MHQVHGAAQMSRASPQQRSGPACRGLLQATKPLHGLPRAWPARCRRRGTACLPPPPQPEAEPAHMRVRLWCRCPLPLGHQLCRRRFQQRPHRRTPQSQTRVTQLQGQRPDHHSSHDNDVAARHPATLFDRAKHSPTCFANMACTSGPLAFSQAWWPRSRSARTVLSANVDLCSPTFFFPAWMLM